MSLKRILFTVLIICLGFVVPAFAIDSFPGSTWGSLEWQVPAHGPQPNIPDLILQGWIRQGADVGHIDGVHLVPYVTLRWTADTKSPDNSGALSWNNTIGPGIGISLITAPFKNSSITIGVENVWNYYFRDWQWPNPNGIGSSGFPSRITDTINVYINWYGYWDLKK